MGYLAQDMPLLTLGPAVMPPNSKHCSNATSAAVPRPRLHWCICDASVVPRRMHCRRACGSAASRLSSWSLSACFELSHLEVTHEIQLIRTIQQYCQAEQALHNKVMLSTVVSRVVNNSPVKLNPALAVDLAISDLFRSHINEVAADPGVAAAKQTEQFNRHI
jgi:hypothetical protein